MRSLSLHARVHFLAVVALVPCSAHAAVAGKTPDCLTTTEWSTIRGAHDANRHAVVAVHDGYQARNPGQQWTVLFDGRGVTTHPDVGGWTWGLQLERYGFSGAEIDACEPTRVRAQGQQVSYDWDATLTEWYVNDGRGLEHGYTVHDRPTGCDHSPLIFTLAVRGTLIPHVQDNGRGVRFTNAGVDILLYAGLSVFDADGVALTAQIDCSSDELLLSIDDRCARYPLTIDPTVQQAYLKASNTGTNDNFGWSVSVSGETVVVGAPGESSNTLGVNGNQGDNSASNAGAVYVFIRSGTAWSQQAYLKASNTDTGDGFGYSVSVSGDTLVVCAPDEDSAATGVNGSQSDNSASSAGAAYVFVRMGTAWSQQAYLKSSNANSGDMFGCSVSVSGDTVIVGARGEASSATGVNGTQTDNNANGAGAAYVFVRSGTAWGQQAYLKASNTGSGGDLFGWSVSVSGDTAVVGSRSEASSAGGVNGIQWDNSVPQAGAAYVFLRTGTTWAQQAYLKASYPRPGDGFGWSVSVSGDIVLVGAPYTVDDDSGAAYVFVRIGSVWTQQAFLRASNPGAGGVLAQPPGEYFGWSVSLSGVNAVVGAWGEDSSATGVNGSQADANFYFAGAAYAFTRTGSTWSQQAYLKASNTDLNDEFGWAVSVSDATVVVGALGEDSNSTGLNGDQADNSFSGAGSAYVFLGDPIHPDNTPYCFGDGSSSHCPCGHVGASGNGCPNSVSGIGGHLGTSGLASIANDTLVLATTNQFPTTPGLYFQGSAPSFSGNVFGNGLLCVVGTTARLEIRFADGTGSSSTTVPIHVLGSCAAGDVRYYQCWYRDDATYCPNAGFNFTNALNLTWIP